MSAIHWMLLATACFTLVAAQASQSAVSVDDGRAVALSNELVCKEFAHSAVLVATNGVWRECTDTCNAHVANLTKENLEMMKVMATSVGMDLQKIIHLLNNAPTVRKCMADASAAKDAAQTNFTNTLLAQTRESAENTKNATALCNSQKDTVRNQTFTQAEQVLAAVRTHSFDFDHVGARSAAVLFALVLLSYKLNMTHPDTRTYRIAVLWVIIQFLVVDKLVSQENAMFKVKDVGTYTKFGNSRVPGILTCEYLLDFYLGLVGCLVLWFTRGVAKSDTHMAATNQNAVVLEEVKNTGVQNAGAINNIAQTIRGLLGRPSYEELESSVEALVKANTTLTNQRDALMERWDEHVCPPQSGGTEMVVAQVPEPTRRCDK